MKKQSMVVTETAKNLVFACTHVDKAKEKASVFYKQVIEANLTAVREDCFKFARGCFTGLPTDAKGKQLGGNALAKLGREQGGELAIIARSISAFCTWYSRNKQVFMTEEERKKEELAKKRSAQQTTADKQSASVERDGNGEAKAKTASGTPIADATNALESNGYRVLSLQDYNELMRRVEEAKTADIEAHERVKVVQSKLVEVTKDRDAKALCLRDALAKIKELEEKLAAKPIAPVAKKAQAKRGVATC